MHTVREEEEQVLETLYTENNCLASHFRTYSLLQQLPRFQIHWGKKRFFFFFFFKSHGTRFKQYYPFHPSSLYRLEIIQTSRLWVFLLIQSLCCDGLNEKSLHRLTSEHLVPSWCNCLGRIRSMALRFKKLVPLLVYSLPPACDSRNELPAVLAIKPSLHHQRLTLWSHKPSQMLSKFLGHDIYHSNKKATSTSS